MNYSLKKCFSDFGGQCFHLPSLPLVNNKKNTEHIFSVEEHKENQP